MLTLLALATGMVTAQREPIAAPDARFRGPPGDGVWYEIFVRSFQDSNGDGIGDLLGVVERLDYLAELGVDGIWLMPIHPSASYHGYDVRDYYDVDPAYGTLDDFDLLIREAHDRGIRVILDFVPNHTALTHPWFLAALRGDAEARARYVWRDAPADWVGLGGPAWHEFDDAWYLGLFWSGMPDLDHSNDEVRDEMKRIMRFWLERGVDGFRVDAIQHIVEGEDGAIAGTPATLAWVREMQQWLGAVAPHAFWLGETYALSTRTVAAYHRDGDLDMSLDYPGWAALFEALSQRSAGPLELALQQDAQLYPEGAVRARFSANHDQLRPASTLGLLRRDEGRLRLVAGLLLTLPGTPLLYYGQEIGMPNGPGDADPQKRTPMAWQPGDGQGFSETVPWIGFSSDDPDLTVARQRDDPSSLWNVYRELIALRRVTPALRAQTTTLLAPEAGPLLALVREDDAGGRVLVVANFATQTAILTEQERPGAHLETLYGPDLGQGDWQVPGLTVVVVRLASRDP